MTRARSNGAYPVHRVWAGALRSRLLLLLAALLLPGSVASAQSIYHIRGNATAGSNNLWSLNPTTGAQTLVYTNYPGGNAATLAQRPSDGMIFYAINTSGGSNGPVYRFNPATPNVAPVLLGTLGGSVGAGFRMAFSGSTLYFMPAGGGGDNNTLYAVNQTTGAATSVATITGTNSGGDMAFLGSTLYMVDQNRNVYTSTTSGGAASFFGTISFGGATPNTIGLAFDGSQMLLQTVSSSAGGQFWEVNGTTATLLSAIGGGTSATGDMSNATVPQPNLAITKTSSVTTVYRGGPITYTIVVTNNGTYTVTGTVTDTLPAAITGETWTCVASAGSSCAAASGSGNINTSTTLEAGDSATYTVTGTISSSASGTLSNTANVAVPVWLTDSNPANNTATETDTINLNANLGITKTDGVASINPGSAVTYTIVVSNAGPDASNGSIVTDTVPASLTGVTWTCGTPTGGATCGAASGSGNTINTTANLPSGSSVRYTVSGTLSATATGTLSNTARVITPASGVSDPNDLGRTGAGNNSAADNTTINTISDMTITKSHSGNFTQGQVGATYTLTARNSGTATTSGTVTVTDTLPTGLTATAISGSGWTCTLATLTCTRSNGLASGTNYPAITVTVTVANNAAPSVTNTAAVSGGGQANTTNDSASDPTTIIQLRDMTIAKSHTGNFTQGQIGATYAITATNSGSTATSGTVTVTDTLPAGLTATAMSGTGWSCVLGTLTCTRSDALAAGASYAVITLTVTVANNAASSVTNVVNVSGGGQVNTSNDSDDDLTTINQVQDLTIAKSHSGNFTQGQVGATYSITATNSGSVPTSGMVTVTDTLPAGLTATAIAGTGWSCVLGTLTCTRSNALAAGSSYPVITLTVTVANNAAASVTNSATVSGGGQSNTANDSATDPTIINQLPDLTIAKSHVGNFTQGQVGAIYSITATNSGFAATSGTVTVTDTLPAGLTATAISGTGWSCVLGTLTCTRSDALASGSSYPVITLTVNVALTAPASVTNSVSVSGGGQSNTANDTANDPTTINPAAPPSISLVKSVGPGGSQIPGTDLLYTVVYTNTGGQPANTFIIVDPNTANVVPAERVFRNVDFKVGSLTSTPGSTGLVATFEYSNDGGSTWTYTPVSGGGAAPSGYDRSVTNVRWSFAGSLSHVGPNNTGSVSLTVRIR